MLCSQVCVITFIPPCLVKIIHSMRSLPHSFIHTTPFCLFLERREGTALQEREGRIDIHLAFKRFVGTLGCYLRLDFLEAEPGRETREHFIYWRRETLGKEWGTWGRGECGATQKCGFRRNLASALTLEHEWCFRLLLPWGERATFCFSAHWLWDGDIRPCG